MVIQVLIKKISIVINDKVKPLLYITGENVYYTFFNDINETTVNPYTFCYFGSLY